MESRLSFVALSSRWCTRRALKPVVMATPRCHLSLWKPARLCDTQLHCWRAPLNLKPLVQVAPRYHHGDTAHYTFHHISPLASTVTGTTSLQHIPVVPAAKMWPSRGGLPVVSRCSRCSQRLVLGRGGGGDPATDSGLAGESMWLAKCPTNAALVDITVALSLCRERRGHEFLFLS
jgi:hypothetical protein